MSSVVPVFVPVLARAPVLVLVLLPSSHVGQAFGELDLFCFVLCGDVGASSLPIKPRGGQKRK